MQLGTWNKQERLETTGFWGHNCYVLMFKRLFSALLILPGTSVSSTKMRPRDSWAQAGVSEGHSGGLASSGWEHSGEPSEDVKGSTCCLPCKTKWNLSKILPLFLSLSSTKTTKGILFPYYEEKAKFLMVLGVAFRNHKGWLAWQTVSRPSGLGQRSWRGV